MIQCRQKKYEFRRRIFKRDVEQVLIYATSPVSRIVGRFKAGRIIEDRPDNLWESLHEFSGINQLAFYEYFKGSKKGFAIEITDFFMFEQPIDPKRLMFNFSPPQSYKYVETTLLTGT
jgi:predicted transcriptional regulator